MNSAEKKSRERRCVDFIAAALGGIGKMNPVGNGWPDGWVQVSGSNIPVEVVEAFERTPDEDPRTGSLYVREYLKAETAAAALHAATGVYPLFGVTRGKGFAIDPTVDVLPIDLYPTEVWGWIAAAVKQKIAKHYAGVGGTILGVHLHHPLQLDAGELKKAANAIGVHPFREIWIVNGYGDPASRLP